MAIYHDDLILEGSIEKKLASPKLQGKKHVSKVQLTTDATATTVLSIPIAQLEGAHVVVEGFFMQDDATEGGRSEITSSFRRATAGNVTECGSPTAVAVEDSAGSPVCTLVANTSTQAVDVKVTGVASTNLTWVVDVFYKKISF